MFITTFLPPVADVSDTVTPVPKTHGIQVVDGGWHHSLDRPGRPCQLTKSVLQVKYKGVVSCDVEAFLPTDEDSRLADPGSVRTEGLTSSTVEGARERRPVPVPPPSLSSMHFFYRGYFGSHKGRVGEGKGGDWLRGFLRTKVSVFHTS